MDPQTIIKQIINIIKNNKISELNKLHSNVINAMFAELNAIIKKSDVLDPQKITQIYILIEGWTLYFIQFGLDSNLLQQAREINETIWAIQKTFTPNSLANFYSKNIDNTVLYFAAVDNLLSVKTLDALNHRLDPKPWNTLVPLVDNLQQAHQHNTPSSRMLLSSLKMPQADENGKFIPSSSSDGGFIVSRLDPYSEEFVRYSVSSDGIALNVGCGYGIPERLSLLLGAKHIICNDLCTEHLTIIKDLTPQNHHAKLELLEGSFPEDIALPNNSLNLIGMFRLLHFFNPEKITQAIKKAHELLAIDGILILSAETLHLGNWQRFIPEYEKQIMQKNPWPGYISDTAIYETAGYSKKLPPEMHFLDVATLTRVLTENGFCIIKCETFGREDSFPASLLLNGRESVGVIAKKSPPTCREKLTN